MMPATSPRRRRRPSYTLSIISFASAAQAIIMRYADSCRCQPAPEALPLTAALFRLISAAPRVGNFASSMRAQEGIDIIIFIHAGA